MLLARFDNNYLTFFVKKLEKNQNYQQQRASLYPIRSTLRDNTKNIDENSEIQLNYKQFEDNNSVTNIESHASVHHPTSICNDK